MLKTIRLLLNAVEQNHPHARESIIVQFAERFRGSIHAT
jgi:hypothetical protein